MAIEKGKRDVRAVLAVVLAVAALVLVNLLADRAFARWDLTAEGRYSLSPSFRAVLTRLNDPLLITYYVSEKPPLEFETRKRDILDRLREIQIAAGRGPDGQLRVELEIADPTKDEALFQRLREENPNIESQAPSIEKDKISLTLFCSGLRLTYRDRRPVLEPQVYSPEELEYKIASGIVALTLKERPVIGVCLPKPPPATDARAPRPRTGFEWITESREFAAKFDLRRVALTESSPIPRDCRLLILIAPKQLSPRARYEIIKYLSEGGHVFLVSSPRTVNREGGGALPGEVGLEDYLSGLGLSWAPGIICDRSNIELPMPVGGAQGSSASQLRPFPYFVQILPANLDQSSPLTRFLPPLVAPWVSEIKLDAARNRAAGLEARVLAKTSKESWNVPLHEFSPSKELPPPAVFDPPKPVFVELSGTFPFPFAGETVPDWPQDEAAVVKRPPGPAAGADPRPGLLYVFACPDGFHGQFLEKPLAEKFAGNFRVLYNVMEQHLSPELVSISTRAYETRTIQRLDGRGQDAQRNAWKLGLIAGVPVLVTLYGLAHFLLRRRAQAVYERRLSATPEPARPSP